VLRSRTPSVPPIAAEMSESCRTRAALAPDPAGRALLTGFEIQDGPPTRHRRWYETAQILRIDTFIEQAIPDERHQIVELSRAQVYRVQNQRIEACSGHRRSHMQGEIQRHASFGGIVAPCPREDVEMEADGVFQVDERSIVEKAGRDGEISQRGRAELVPISLIAGDR